MDELSNKSRIAIFSKPASNFNGFGVVCYRPRAVEKDNSHLVEEGFLLVSSDPREVEAKGSEYLTLREVRLEYDAAIKISINNGWSKIYEGDMLEREDLCQMTYIKNSNSILIVQSMVSRN